MLSRPIFAVASIFPKEGRHVEMNECHNLSLLPLQQFLSLLACIEIEATKDEDTVITLKIRLNKYLPLLIQITIRVYQHCCLGGVWRISITVDGLTSPSSEQFSWRIVGHPAGDDQFRL